MVLQKDLKPKNEGEAIRVAKVVLKRRDRNLVANAERARTIQKLRKLRKSQPKLVTAVNGDALLRKRRKAGMDKENVILMRKKQSIENRIPAEATCILVARNNRNPELPKVREALAKLGVFRHSDCRIVSTTAGNLDLIRQCDAYIYYGTPTPETISTLVHKKAYVAVPKTSKKEDTRAKPLNNNAVVEDVLGQYGLVCVEDLVDVLVKGRDNQELFDKVSKFISSFKINAEQKKSDSKFKNERASRGFLPKIETIISRLV
jgi:large subunit ribosomal protein L7e